MIHKQNQSIFKIAKSSFYWYISDLPDSIEFLFSNFYLVYFTVYNPTGNWKIERKFEEKKFVKSQYSLRARLIRHVRTSDRIISHQLCSTSIWMTKSLVLCLSLLYSPPPLHRYNSWRSCNCFRRYFYFQTSSKGSSINDVTPNFQFFDPPPSPCHPS